MATSKWNQEKAELTQRIDFLNRKLTEENRKSFVPTQSFEFRDTLNPSTPKVIYDDQNMKNPSYRRAIHDYEETAKSYKIMITVFAILSVVMVLTLLILYPEFLREMLNNEGPS